MDLTENRTMTSPATRSTSKVLIRKWFWAESRVPHGPQVDGMEQLKAHLLDSRKYDVAENVIRRLLAYGIGRDLNYRDPIRSRKHSPTVQ